MIFVCATIARHKASFVADLPEIKVTMLYRATSGRNDDQRASFFFRLIYLLEMAHIRQHRQPRFHHHAYIPRATRANFHVDWITDLGVKTCIGENDFVSRCVLRASDATTQC